MQIIKRLFFWQSKTTDLISESQKQIRTLSEILDSCQKDNYEFFDKLSNTDLKIVEMFKMLSKDVIESRKLISQLKSKVAELDERIWIMEDHSVEENLERAKNKVEAFTEKSDELVKAFKGLPNNKPETEQNG